MLPLMASAARGNNLPIGGMVVDEMVRIRDLVAMLENQMLDKLQDNPAAKAFFRDLTTALSRAFSLLDLRSGTTLQETRGPHSGGISPTAKRKFAQLGDGNPRSGGGGRRRSESSSVRQVIAKNLNDGRTWRKYGQKDIQSHKHPRSYFRCTHKNDQGCKAIRHVQLSEDDASTYIITYMGEHTCRDPATVPLITSPPNLDHSRLIIFATNAATTIPDPFLSMKKESDDEVLSNISNYGSSPSDFSPQTTAEVSAAVSTPVTAPISDHRDFSPGLLSPASNVDLDSMGDLDFDLSFLDDFL